MTGQDETRAFAELLRPEPLAAGAEREERFIICRMSWERYLALDKVMGEDRPQPRFYYLDGDLEIITTSNEHERIKKWIGDFLADYFIQAGDEIFPRGQATIRQALKLAGAEPDESWCLGREKEIPDLVLEIALTSGGANKLEIYRRFGVQEVWVWKNNRLEVFALSNAHEYEQIAKSRLLPNLDLSLLERCAAIRSWRQARQTFRAGIAAH